MALQGTIDTIPLGDVLGLVASGRRTGRLEVTGDRGRAELWIADGDVVGGSPAGRPVGTAAELVADALRFSSGEFAFTAEADAPSPNVEPLGVEECLGAAAAVLAEWERIDAVVPSTKHGVALAAEAPQETITLSSAEWRTLAAAAAGSTVGDVVRALGAEELPAMRSVVDLVDRGLVEIGEPPPTVRGTGVSQEELLPVDPDSAEPDGADAFAGWDPSMAGDDVDDTGGAEPHAGALEVEDGPATVDDFPVHFPIDDLIEGEEDGDDPWTSPEMEQLEARRSAVPGVDGIGIETVPLDAGAPAPWSAIDDDAAENGSRWSGDLPWPAEDEHLPAEPAPADGTDEVLRQMSRLSPQAAEAIATALGSAPAEASHEPSDEAPR